MFGRFQTRYGTAVEWDALNPTLEEGEPGYVLPDEGSPSGLKIGDGVTPWSMLPFISSDGASDSQIASYVTDSGSSTHAAIADLVVPATDQDVADFILDGGSYSSEAVIQQVALSISAGGTNPIRNALSETYVPQQMNKFQNVVVGEGAMAASTDLKARNNNAFGIGALAHAERARYNDAFGLDALHYLNSGLGEPDSTTKATRNSAFGSNSQRFNETGRNNVSMGRNAAQNNVTGDHNTIIGAGALTTTAPIGLDGEIQNQVPQNVSLNVAVGTSALAETLSDGNTGVGYQALQRLSNGGFNTALGHRALASLDSNLGEDGRVISMAQWAVPYEISGSTLTITRASHGLPVGTGISITFPGSSRQYLKIVSVTSNTFVLNQDVSSLDDGTGTADLHFYTSDQGNDNSQNTAVGNLALEHLIGALPGSPASRLNTALGHQALRFMQDGTNCTEVWGSTGIGQGSRVSGNEQVQIGNQAVTVYTQQAIQTRSDARDKTDIRDTPLGSDFLRRLRPVEFRWDNRVDYHEETEDGIVVHERDGSKAGKRYHQGLVAQEVKQVMDDLGIDFAGYQDHTVNGGNDVLTIAYSEFIGPLIRAFQELDARVRELEAA